MSPQPTPHPTTEASRPVCGTIYCRARNQLLADCPLERGPLGCPLHLDCQAFVEARDRRPQA